MQTQFPNAHNNSKQKNAETIDTKLFTSSFHMTKPANTKLSNGLSASYWKWNT